MAGDTSRETFDDERHQFTIELPNLIAILGCALYSSWQVAIRELVQNAHDSVVRLAMRAGPTSEARIHVSCDAERNVITVEDSGEGMTRDQVMNDLSCIGAGGSGQLRRLLVREGRQDEAKQIMGQFGIGLLASFLLADRVEVETRAWNVPPEEGVLWRSHGGAGYTIKATRRRRPGTKVSLHLGLGGESSFLPPFHIQHRRALALAEVTQPGRLRQVVRQYCELLPVEIVCDGQTISRRHLPWQDPVDAAAASRTFIEQRFGKDVDDVIVVSEAWCDGVLGGAFFIRDEPDIGPGRGNPIAVFLQKMYVSQNDGSILPSWARFLSGVVNAWELSPDLDREDVKRDQAFAHARHLVGQAIMRAFRELAEQQPDRLQRLVSRHSRTLKEHVSEMPSELVAHIARHLQFNTVNGLRPLGEILQGQSHTDGRTLVFCASGYDLRRHLLGGLDPDYLIVPADEREQQALQSCVDAIPTLRLKKYAVEPEEVLPAARHPKWRLLESFCRSFPWFNTDVQVAEFPSTDVPGLVLRRAMPREHTDTVTGLIGPALDTASIDARLTNRGQKATTTQECFFLNSNCDVNMRFCERLESGRLPTAHSDAMQFGIRAIWDAARMVSGERITPDRALRLLNGHRDLANRLLAMAEAHDGLEPVAVEDEATLTCFLACPFDDHADGLQAIVEGELRKIEPRWQVIRADAISESPELFKNFALMIRHSRLCVADLTGLNPNVLVETGMALALGKRIIPMVAREDLSRIPADLQHLTIEPYDPLNRGQGIAAAVRKIMRQQNR